MLLFGNVSGDPHFLPNAHLVLDSVTHQNIISPMLVSTNERNPRTPIGKKDTMGVAVIIYLFLVLHVFLEVTFYMGAKNKFFEGKRIRLAVMSQGPSQRRRQNPNGAAESSSSSQSDDSVIHNEIILRSVFASMKWDVHALCQTASVNRKLRALAKRLLWKEMCIYGAPRMIASLMDGAPNGRIGGEWDAMAKLLFFCCGCNSTRHFQMGHPYPGHFVKSSRFSKTSGRSFLVKRCRTDLLYVSDPCEHKIRDRDDDLGIFRGVFGGFTKSKTRACLITRQLEFEEGVRCPFCGGRVWSMTAARLVPRSAARRVGTLENGLEYFVCVNGHLHGSCWLVPLSSDENADKDNDADDDEDDGEDYGDGRNQIGSNGTVSGQKDGPTS